MLTDRTPGAWLLGCYRGRVAVHSLVMHLGWGSVPQQRAALREFLLPHAVGQEAEVPQPMEPMRRDVEHEPPQEFDGGQGQRAQAMTTLVIPYNPGHRA